MSIDKRHLDTVEGECIDGSIGQHRKLWKLKRGPIPKGMHVHHKCHNRRCINLEHLEVLRPLHHRWRHPQPPRAVVQLREHEARAILETARASEDKQTWYRLRVVLEEKVPSLWGDE